MPRYIDAELLEQAIVKPSMFDINKDDVLALIAEIPTADVVEVVRCKECMYHDDICKHPDGLFRTTDNSYCSFGKRKEKNENRLD